MTRLSLHDPSNAGYNLGMSMNCKYDELSCAHSVDDVLRVTGEFLSSWTSEELERLPVTCRPQRVSSYEDIEFWADRLKDESDKAVLFMDDEHQLDRLTTHFLIASVRLRQMAGVPLPT